MNNFPNLCKCLIVGLALYVIPAAKAEWVSSGSHGYYSTIGLGNDGLVIDIPYNGNVVTVHDWNFIVSLGGQAGLDAAYAHDQENWSLVFDRIQQDFPGTYQQPVLPPAGIDGLAADSAAVWAAVKAMAISIALLGALLFVTRKLRTL